MVFCGFMGDSLLALQVSNYGILLDLFFSAKSFSSFTAPLKDTPFYSVVIMYHSFVYYNY